MIQTIEGEGIPVVYAHITDPRLALESRVAPVEGTGAYIAAFSDRDFAEIVAQAAKSMGTGKGVSIGISNVDDIDIPTASRIEAEIEQSEVLAANLDCPEFRTSGVVAREIGHSLVALRRCASDLWDVYSRQARKRLDDEARDKSIRSLLLALKKHRLLFLYAATAEHPEPPSGSSRTPPFIEQLDTPGWDKMVDDIDGDGEFLWRHARVLNSYADRAIGKFGPSIPLVKNDVGDKQQEPAPFWSLNTGLASDLEDSVDKLISALQEARPLIDQDLVRMIAGVARPGDINRWNDLLPIPWGYLGSLDAAVAVLQMRQLDATENLEAIKSRSSSDMTHASAILLLQMAQAYYVMLESVLTQKAHGLDARLNGCYLWLIKQIRNLLKNDSALSIAEINFDPFLPDLLPSTVMDVEWEYMAQPAAESLLGDVQRYLIQENIADPDEGSDDYVFVELFRPSIDECVSLAQAYAERMSRGWERMLRLSGDSSAEQATASQHVKHEEGTVNAPDELNESESEPDDSRELWVDASTYQLHFRGQTYQFNDGISFKLLERLTRRIGHPVRVDALIEDVWERQEGGTANRKAVSTAIGRLRSKLEELKVNGIEITGTSVHGCYVVKTTPRSS